MTIISINGVIGWDVSPNDIRNKLEKAKGDILVEIASPGGFVFDGLEIFNLLRDYKGKVTTRLMGIAASMASYIALAGDVVEAHDNAIFMIHNAMSFAVGNHNDMREQADFLENLSNHLAKAYTKKTGMSLSEIKNIMDDEGWYFGEEAKAAGFVDIIIETDKEKDKSSALLEAKAELSNCVDIMKDNELVKNDLNKAAALITPIAKKTNSSNGENQKPKPKEVKKTMAKLKDFLNENSEAKAEFDKLIVDAQKKGVETGIATVQARIDGCKNYLNNKDYPTVSSIALDVLENKSEVATLTASVAAIDAVLGKKASEQAKAETEETPETPGEGEDGSPELSEDGSIKNDADFEASMKRLQGV